MGRKKVVQRMIDEMKKPKEDLRKWWEVGATINGKSEKFFIHAEAWDASDLKGSIDFLNFEQDGVDTFVASFKTWEYVIDTRGAMPDSEVEEFGKAFEKLKKVAKPEDLPKNFGQIM